MYQYTDDEARLRIASYIAREFDSMSSDIDIYVNLGIGIPSLIADCLESKRVFLEVENGMLGAGPAADESNYDPLLINAGRKRITETKGCCYLSSADSFGLIRGGHLDATVIGAFEVDEEGTVANWIIPNGDMLGVGGAMDLLCGARKVYVAMKHLSKKGDPKLLHRCTLPISAYRAASTVVTEYAAFHFVNGVMTLVAKSSEMSYDELKSITPANYSISGEVAEF